MSLVLASLSIDSSGVVTGIRQSNTALASGDKALEKFGTGTASVGNAAQALTGKLFNFSGAITAIGRSLGVVGLVTALAFALKGLVSDLVENTTWFRNASAAVTDWWNALAKGETASQQFVRHLKEIGEGTGIKFIPEMVEDLRKLNQARYKAYDAAIEAGKGQQVANAIFEQAAAPIQALIDKLHEAGASYDQLRASGLAPNQIKLTQGPELGPGNYAGAVEFAAAQTERAAAAAKAWAASISVMLPDVQVLGNEMAVANENSDFFDRNNIAFLEEFDSWMTRTSGDTAQLTAAMNANADAGARMGDTIREKIIASLTYAALKVQTLNMAFQAIGQAIGAAATAGGSSSKAFFGEILRGLAAVLAAWGALLIADGIESNNYGKVAAGVLAIAAGVAASAAAAKYGGSGESSSGGGGRGRGETQNNQTANLSATANRPAVTINIQGSMFGTDLDNLARDVSRLINTAQSDGAR